MWRRTTPSKNTGATWRRADLGRLFRERDRLMAEIALRSSVGALPPAMVTARALLIARWAKASWAARFEILSVARWLLALDRRSALLRPAKAASRGRSPGRIQSTKRNLPTVVSGAQCHPRKGAQNRVP